MMITHATQRASSAVARIIGLDPAYGLSTGWDPAIRRDYEAAVAEAASFSTGAIELSALAAEDLPHLSRYLASAPASRLKAFDHISVHGPAKHLPRDETGWRIICAYLRDLPESVSGTIIMHPDTLVDAPVEPLRKLGSRLVLENMDCRKSDCRSAAEMVPVFETFPEAGFCLDVAHVWTIDRSLEEGARMLDAFGERLREVHVSGIDPDGHHRVTTPGDLRRYERLLGSCQGVPWVFESPLNVSGSN